MRSNLRRARLAVAAVLLLPASAFAAPQLVLVSSFAIGPLLARGCLVADDDELAAAGSQLGVGKLLVGAAPVQSSWINAVEHSARNTIPIAIQLRPGRSIRLLRPAGSSRSIEAVCLSDTLALLFRTQKELSRFSAVEFGNYSLEALRIPMKVDASAFDQASGSESTSTLGSQVENGDSGSVHKPPAELEVADVEVLRVALRRADSLAGAVAYLLTSSPGRHSWMRGVKALSDGGPQWSADSSWPEKTMAAVMRVIPEVSDADRALLLATVDVVSTLPVEQGWPTDQVLSDVRRRAMDYTTTAGESATKEIALWADRAREVLEARAEPHSLSDDAHVVSRAILLLLLRGDLENIVNGIATSVGRQRPGLHVLGVASCLAAFRTGARALPSRCKTGVDGEGSGRLLDYVGELFAGYLQSESSSLFPPGVPRPELSYRRIRTLQGEWVTKVNTREISRIPAVFDTGLERLFSMGRDLGFEFEEHGESGLATRVVSSDGRQRPVYLRVLKGDSAAGAVVRFSSPTLRVTGVKSRSRLPKELLLDLLERNADPEINCRFAIEQDEGPVVVVLVDQLLGTLDEAEFQKHVVHVAQVASSFDLSHAPSTTVGE